MQRSAALGRLHNAVTSFVFAITGVGTAILGAALPAMLGEWHLDDRAGGTLLLVAFTGSTLGAVLVHKPRRFAPAAGMLLCSCGTALAFVAGRHWADLAFLLYGLGLGVTMTAISLIRSQAVGPAGNHREMNRLNLLWAGGACCAPFLAFHALERISVTSLLRTATAILLASASALAVSGEDAGSAPTRQAASPSCWAPARLCLFAGTAVALETAIGSWLTTYTQRSADQTGYAVSATALFWGGLLLSRLLHALPAGHMRQCRRGIWPHLASVTVATVLLITSPYAGSLLIAAFLAGWGLGPLYPLALSVALPQYRPGGVFIAAGLGSSCLPWLTGALSSEFHSLRAGLTAPAFSVLLLLAAALAMRSEIPSTP